MKAFGACTMQTTRHKVFDTLQCGISLKLISVKTQVSLESIEVFCIEEQYADSLANSAISAVGRGGSSDKFSLVSLPPGRHLLYLKDQAFIPLGCRNSFRNSWQNYLISASSTGGFNISGCRNEITKIGSSFLDLIFCLIERLY